MVPACLPIPPSLRVAALLLAADGLTILAASAAAHPRCPVCGQPAQRGHSRYWRTLAGSPWAGVAVRLRVAARKFFCDDGTCPRKVFAERLDGVAAVRARRTDRQRRDLEAIVFALGGEAGVRRAHLGKLRISNGFGSPVDHSSDFFSSLLGPNHRR